MVRGLYLTVLLTMEVERREICLECILMNNMELTSEILKDGIRIYGNYQK